MPDDTFDLDSAYDSQGGGVSELTGAKFDTFDSIGAMLGDDDDSPDTQNAAEGTQEPTGATEQKSTEGTTPPGSEGSEEPTGAPEADFQPEWFNDVKQAMATPDLPGFGPPTGPPPGPPPGYGYPPPGYGPPPGYRPPQPDGGKDPRYNEINALFDDPKGYISSILNAGIRDFSQQYSAGTKAEIARVMHANAENAMYHAENNIKRGYKEVLSKDNAYRSNAKVRELVDGALKTLSFQAANAAFNGNYDGVRVFENPGTYAALCSAAKSLAGAPATQSEPAVPHGAAPARVSQRADAGKRVVLPPDLEEVARTIGTQGFREQLEREYAETMRQGDLTW